MNPTASLMLFGWPVAALLLFMVMRPRRAVIATILLAWLFLPIAWYKLPGLPAYTKMIAAILSALLGVAVFDTRRLLAFRPGWADLPMGLWCISPLFSSLSNDLGIHDGFTSLFYQTFTFGVPYLLGRIYLTDLLGMYELAMGIFLGGLIYMPLCLLEIRLSPQLHTWVYGFHQHVFEQSLRWGGYRPTVFMDHGLMVGMWMSMATVSGFWLWFSGTTRSLFGISILWFLVPLAITTILCKSFGALVLLMVGIGVLIATRNTASRAFLIALAIAPVLYIALRLPGIWSGGDLTELVSNVAPTRAASLQFRLENEDRLLERAQLRPLFGWGGWGRARVRDAQGRDISVTDGLWIIALGNTGFFGLASLTGSVLVSLGGLMRRFPARAWRHRYVAPAVAMCVMVLLFFVDCLFNDMKNPAYTLAGGGLAYLKLGKVKGPEPAVAQSRDVRWLPDSSS
jgi:hypothetical protein